MCKVPSIDSQPTWREKEDKNKYGDTWHWQELLINLWPSKRSYKFGDTFQYKLNLWYVGIWEAGKPKYREKILLEQMEEPTINSTHMWRRSWDSTPGHTGGRRMLSPLHHPCSNKTKTMVCWIFLFFSLIQQQQTTTSKDCHIWLLRGLLCERSRVWFTDVTSNPYQNGQNTIFTWGLICSAI